MKKVNFLFSCLLLWMVGMTYAMAKTVTPYKVDFLPSRKLHRAALAILLMPMKQTTIL